MPEAESIPELDVHQPERNTAELKAGIRKTRWYPSSLLEVMSADIDVLPNLNSTNSNAVPPGYCFMNLSTALVRLSPRPQSPQCSWRPLMLQPMLTASSSPSASETTGINPTTAWVPVYLSHSSPLIFCPSVQFSSVTQSCPTLCNPMDCSTPGLPVHHPLLELAQTHDHWVRDAIQPSHPL